MHVVVNRLVLAGARTGIGHYTAQLLRCLREQIGTDRIDGTPQGWLRRAHALGARLRPLLEGRKKRGPGPAAAAPAGPTKPSWRAWALSSLRRGGRRLLLNHFRALCARHRYDVYHEPNFIPMPVDVPTVATLHDLSVLLHPEWHPADRVAHFERRFRRGLGRCVHYFSISEFGRQELIDTLNLRPEQVTRTYMGIRPGLGPLPEAQVRATLKQLGLPEQYLLYLGTIEPRKNVLTLLRAYCALSEAFRRRYPLVLVGGWGWNAGDVAAFLDREARHRGVLHLGYVPEEHIPVLYNGARALVFPSFYEGFGLPPIEMMACGGAVLASTAGALVETVGSKAHLVEPLDVEGWRSALKRVGDDDDWWQSLRQGAMEVARPFTWEQCAADTLRVYRQLTGGSTGRLDRAA